MAVLMEQMLRRLIQENRSKVVYINPITALTPSAGGYINSQALVAQESLDQQDEDKEEPQVEEIQDPETIQTVTEPYSYRLYGTQAQLKERPEAITTLTGQDLVDKDRPRVRFRGQMGSLEATLLLTVGEPKTTISEQVIQRLKEVYQCTRLVLEAEVTGEQVQDLFLLGKDSGEIRSIAHHPKKYSNQDHLILEGGEKLETLKINCLRTRAREMEVTAVELLSRISGQERPDLLKTLNRLSNAFYYLMYLGGQGK